MSIKTIHEETSNIGQTYLERLAVNKSNALIQSSFELRLYKHETDDLINTKKMEEKI